MDDTIKWLTTMFNAGGTDMAIAIAIMVVSGLLLISWLLLPFAVFGIKSRIGALTRATNYNTAEVRALRNDNAKAAKRNLRAEVMR
ncbi:hypothetical protein [Kordiimonas aquimaris]|uniref:hypothetical protein n=1 Tax=Kordiimonas aquimaris TaxID=707591 RepID=UPI0021D24779|nr:hypothetical protein [Kordiimonas aquimaris]